MSGVGGAAFRVAAAGGVGRVVKVVVMAKVWAALVVLAVEVVGLVALIGAEVWTWIGSASGRW